MSFMCSKYNLTYQIYFHEESVPRDAPITHGRVHGSMDVGFAHFQLYFPGDFSSCRSKLTLLQKQLI